MLQRLAAAFIILSLVACGNNNQQKRSVSTQADVDWQVLFDGTSTAGWRTVGKDHLRPEWKIIDGALMLEKKGGGDITNGIEYADFELALEWNISEAGNSGIFYLVDPSHSETKPWESGPEMQILDNAGHKDGKDEFTNAGSAFALFKPEAKVANPAGQWNSVRVRVEGSKVEHWLNGHKVVAYDLASEQFKQRVESTKFKRWQQTFGKSTSGLIVLQDHGDQVRFRNIRIRSLKQ